MAFELLAFIGIFALALGVIGVFIGAEDNERRRLRSELEARRFAKQPWDAHPDDIPGTPVR